MDKFSYLLDLDKTRLGDSARLALFYLIAINEDLFNNKSMIYDFKKHSFNEDCFKKITVSSGAYKLLVLGANLYNDNYYKADVMDTFSGLDDDNFQHSINAINIRFGKHEVESD